MNLVHESIGNAKNWKSADKAKFLGISYISAIVALGFPLQTFIHACPSLCQFYRKVWGLPYTILYAACSFPFGFYYVCKMSWRALHVDTYRPPTCLLCYILNGGSITDLFMSQMDGWLQRGGGKLRDATRLPSRAAGQFTLPPVVQGSSVFPTS